MQTSALISADGRYRYQLGRAWEPGAGQVCWVMLNPSTADANEDDPTIRRCIGYAKAWGYGTIEVVNLFALRATDPRELVTSDFDPVGTMNNIYIAESVLRSQLVVCAWGARGSRKAWGGLVVRRDKDVMALIQRAGVKAHLLEKTKAGAPKHPLYLKGDLKPSLME